MPYRKPFTAVIFCAPPYEAILEFILNFEFPITYTFTWIFAQIYTPLEIFKFKYESSLIPMCQLKKFPYKFSIVSLSGGFVCSLCFEFIFNSCSMLYISVYIQPE
jgi:hypothetical protein